MQYDLLLFIKNYDVNTWISFSYNLISANKYMIYKLRKSPLSFYFNKFF